MTLDCYRCAERTLAEDNERLRERLFRGMIHKDAPITAAQADRIARDLHDQYRAEWERNSMPAYIVDGEGGPMVTYRRPGEDPPFTPIMHPGGGLEVYGQRVANDWNEEKNQYDDRVLYRNSAGLGTPERAALCSLSDIRIAIADFPVCSNTHRELFDLEEPEQWTQWHRWDNGDLSSQQPGALIRRFTERHYIAIVHFIYTKAIIIGYLADATGYNDRWCYETFWDAMSAASQWEPEILIRQYAGQGYVEVMNEPEGWHRHPRTGRRRPGGDASKQYINK